jgi:hypothetical protein
MLSELADGLLWVATWDDYEGLARIRAAATKDELSAAAQELAPTDRLLLGAMVKNANAGTIPELIPEKPIKIRKDPRSIEFRVGSNYLVNGISVLIESIGTDAITGKTANGFFFMLYDEINSIKIVKPLVKI